MSVAREPYKDPVKIAPEIYKVLLENDRVRVLEIRLKAGGKSPLHSHPACLVCSLTPSKVKFTRPDGTTETVELQPGQTIWNEAETHAAENVGAGELRVLNVEFK